MYIDIYHMQVFEVSVSRRLGSGILVLALLLTVMSVAASGSTASAAPLTTDQQCSSIGGSFIDGIGTNAPTGQTFIPTQSSIVSFAIHIRSTNGDSTPMTASVLSGGIGGPLIGSVDFSVPAGFGSPTGEWLTVQFPSGLSLTPQSVYALDVKDNSGSSGIKWDACSAAYGNGCGYANGVCEANSWGFIEYSGDFTLGLSSTGLTVAQGSTGTVTVLVGSQDNFASPVVLSLSGPTGVTGIFNANPGRTSSGTDSIATSSGSTSEAALSIFVPRTVAVGAYPLTVTASSGSTSHSITLTLTVSSAGTALASASPGFIAQSSPAMINLSPGAFRSTTMIISSVSGFNSQVDLATSWVGAAPSEVTVSLPSPVTVPAGGTGTSTLTLNAANSPSTGTFTLQITATGGGNLHSTQVTVVIAATPTALVPVAGSPDFTAQPSSAALSLSTGGFQSASLVISSVSGFSSQVALSDAWVGATPAGVSVSLPSLVTVSAGGTVTLTLTLNAADSVSTGVYTLLIIETGEGILHSTELTINIVDTPAVFVPVASEPAFSISPSSSTLSTTQGLSTSTNVIVNSIAGFSSTVTSQPPGLAALQQASALPYPNR